MTETNSPSCTTRSTSRSASTSSRRCGTSCARVRPPTARRSGRSPVLHRQQEPRPTTVGESETYRIIDHRLRASAHRHSSVPEQASGVLRAASAAPTPTQGRHRQPALGRSIGAPFGSRRMNRHPYSVSIDIDSAIEPSSTSTVTPPRRPGRARAGTRARTRNAGDLTDRLAVGPGPEVLVEERRGRLATARPDREHQRAATIALRPFDDARRRGGAGHSQMLPLRAAKCR